MIPQLCIFIYQVDSMREEVRGMKERYDRLAVEVSDGLSELQKLQQKWQDARSVLEGVSSWVADTRTVLAEARAETEEGTGDVGEMKTLLERLKGVAAEVDKKKEEVEAARLEAARLPGDDAALLGTAAELGSALSDFESTCAELTARLDGEISEQAEYQRAAQEVEKWLLQMSFQLMAHNSLYITTRDQTQEQIEQHEKLMEEIKGYQATLDAVREMGHAQVAR